MDGYTDGLHTELGSSHPSGPLGCDGDIRPSEGVTRSAITRGAAGSSFLPIIERALSGTTGWRILPGTDQSAGWIRVGRESRATPPQGWKLHVSASIWSAEEVLCAVLPVVLEEDATFKLVASLGMLGSLNQGDGGLSQIGKFLTIYPNDDAQAVRLALALDEATRGLRGPVVPSDRPLRPGSLVHYRYGGFGDRYMQTPLGELAWAMATPAGELVPDRRLAVYRPPDWVTDPFQEAGLSCEPPPSSPLIGGRYLVAASMHQSPRGAIYLAADLEGDRGCVLKRARRNGYIGWDGHDACDRLLHEAEILARLAPNPAFPAVYGLFEHEGDLYLAMEDIEGRTLEAHVREQLAWGRLVPEERVIAWGVELAAMLGAIHEAGLVYRDIKSPNVIMAGSGGLRLIDFELAHDPSSPGPMYGRGTPGYVSPQQASGETPTPADDVYGLGALLFFGATGAEPSLAPNRLSLLDRPLELLRPGISQGLAMVIACCLDPTPAGRFTSMKELAAALREVDARAPSLPLPFGCEALPPGYAERSRYRDLAHRLGDSLCSAARQSAGGSGVAWLSAHPSAIGIPYRDLNIGCAGAVLALSEVVVEMGDREHRRVLADGVSWLAASPRPAGPAVPGLYVGEAGVGAALLRAGQVLGDEALVGEAAARGRWIGSLPYASPDLFNGTAGRLRFHLLLWDETGGIEHLHHAVEAGESLLSAAEDAGDGRVRWTIPPGHDGLSGQAYVGYAHGAAGIGDALLDLYEATGREEFAATALGAARWVGGQAHPALEDGSGLDWPTVEQGGPGVGMWCHGAAGVGRFLLHAAGLTTMPNAMDLAVRAARKVARGTRWAGPLQCHGLAGNIEFLLDVFRATGDAAYLVEARSLGRLLEAFASERDGVLVWPSEQPMNFTPDYMVGYAGVAVCLLRLADPESMPTQLSRSGFRRRSNPGGLWVGLQSVPKCRR